MTLYAISQTTITDPQKMQEYLDRVGPTIPEGVKLLASDETPRVIEGKDLAPRTVLLEFPSRDVFENWYHSPEYQELANLRMSAAPGTFILIEGVDE